MIRSVVLVALGAFVGTVMAAGGDAVLAPAGTEITTTWSISVWIGIGSMFISALALGLKIVRDVSKAHSDQLILMARMEEMLASQKRICEERNANILRVLEKIKS